jgi:hypothetical protein
VGLYFAGQVPERGLKIAQHHITIQQAGDLHQGKQPLSLAAEGIDQRLSVVGGIA